VTRRLLYTPQAREDIERLYQFLADDDLPAARVALASLDRAASLLTDFPFLGRKVTPDNPFQRELVVPFGNAGYLLLFEIEHADIITVLAVRHQREDDYH